MVSRALCESRAHFYVFADNSEKCRKKQAGNLLLRKKKISKIFREKVIFLRKICRFSVENLTFFELFSRNFDAEKGDNQA
jgi:hypothetical protein